MFFFEHPVRPCTGPDHKECRPSSAREDFFIPFFHSRVQSRVPPPFAVVLHHAPIRTDARKGWKLFGRSNRMAYAHRNLVFCQGAIRNAATFDERSANVRERCRAALPHPRKIDLPKPFNRAPFLPLKHNFALSFRNFVPAKYLHVSCNRIVFITLGTVRDFFYLFFFMW